MEARSICRAELLDRGCKSPNLPNDEQQVYTVKNTFIHLTNSKDFSGRTASAPPVLQRPLQQIAPFELSPEPESSPAQVPHAANFDIFDVCSDKVTQTEIIENGSRWEQNRL